MRRFGSQEGRRKRNHIREEYRWEVMGAVVDEFTSGLGFRVILFRRKM